MKHYGFQLKTAVLFQRDLRPGVLLKSNLFLSARLWWFPVILIHQFHYLTLFIFTNELLHQKHPWKGKCPASKFWVLISFSKACCWTVNEIIFSLWKYQRKKKKKSNKIFPLFTPATLVLQHENCTVFLQTRNFTAAFREQLFPALFSSCSITVLLAWSHFS